MGRLSKEFVKLEIRLLNDHRFWGLDEFDQLVYVKLLMIAKSTKNQIPKNQGLLEGYLRTKRSQSEVKVTLDRIKTSFPKLKENKHFMYFDDWEYRLNNKDIKNTNNSCVEEDLDIDKDIDIEMQKQFTHLNNDLFKKELNDFIKMRSQIKKPATKMAIERILKNLSNFEVSIATKMLEQSIINNWQGVFELKTNGFTKNKIEQPSKYKTL